MKRKANQLATWARWLLGAILTLYGLNGFLNFLPMPQFSEGAMAFMGAMMATGYMMPMLSLAKLVAGVCLLVDKWSELWYLLLVPLTLNIVLFHVFLDLNTIWPGLIVAVLHVYLLRESKGAYKSLCKC